MNPISHLYITNCQKIYVEVFNFSVLHQSKEPLVESQIQNFTNIFFKNMKKAFKEKTFSFLSTNDKLLKSLHLLPLRTMTVQIEKTVFQEVTKIVYENGRQEFCIMLCRTCFVPSH